MDPEFAEAFIHRLPRGGSGQWSEARGQWSEHIVLGRRLRPFSLWHETMLDFIESPLWRNGGAADRGTMAEALARAVRICRSRQGESDVRPIGGWRATWKLLGRGLERELRAFQMYVADFRQIPDYQIIPPRNASRSEPRGQPPDALKMIAGVIAIAGCSRREAWEMPSGEARWWYAMHLRATGSDLDFDSAEEKAERARIEREEPALHEKLKKAAEDWRKQVERRSE